MTQIIDCLTTVEYLEEAGDTFVVGIYDADFPKYPDFDAAGCRHQYVPLAARHKKAKMNLTVSVTREPREVETEVGRRNSVVEFATTVTPDDKIDEHMEFISYDRRENWAMDGTFEREILPSWLLPDGGDCYLTMELKYEERTSRESLDTTENAVEQARERAKEKFDRFGVDYEGTPE